MSELERGPVFSGEPNLQGSLESGSTYGNSTTAENKPKITDKIFDGLRDEDRERTEYLDEGLLYFTQMISTQRMIKRMKKNRNLSQDIRVNSLNLLKIIRLQ